MARFRLLTCLLAISRKLQSDCFWQMLIGVKRESAANQLQKNGKRQDCSKTKECWAHVHSKHAQKDPEIENMIDAMVF